MPLTAEKRVWLWEKSINVIGALYFGYFAYVMLVDFLDTHRVSSLLLLIYEALIIGLFLLRAMPREVSWKFYDWFVAVAGTGVALLYRPAPEVNDHVLLHAVQLAGILFSLVGMASLNKSFGTIPANRGVKTGGMYRFIRHPVYAGYVVTYSAYVIQNATATNTLIYLTFLILTVARIRAEEAFLSRDAGYVAFKQKTRWRLVPYVW